MAGHATWACNDEGRRESQSSNLSDEDWEVVQKRDSLSGAGRSTGVVALPGTVLARAGDWLQWGVDGAVKGVEKTVEGIKGVWHYRRISEERRNALELASRQQWMLMEVEHERRKERDRIEKEEAVRKREMDEHLRHVEDVKSEKERAVARLREQMALLERATQQEQNKESLIEDLRREAEQRRFQEAAALSALEELRERQHLAAEEGREKARILEERETEIKNQQEAHQKQIAELEAELAQFKEQQVMDVAASARRLSPAQRLSWGAQRNSGNSDLGGLPDEFFCSITLDVMQDPVLAADGFSYERGAIEDWFAKGHRTSPKTGAQIAHTELQPNLAIRNLIQHAIGKKKSDPPLEDDID